MVGSWSAGLDWMEYLRFYSAVLSALILYIFPALIYTYGWN